MRFLVLIACTLIMLGVDGCGSKRKLEERFSAGDAPTASNDGGVTVRIIHFKQSDHYLVANINVVNNSPDVVLIKNGDGNSLPAFKAVIDGNTYYASRRGNGTWNPWTGYQPRPGLPETDLELSPGSTIGMELRWDCEASRRDYDWSITVTNLTSHDRHLGDVTIPWPQGGER